MIYSDIFLLVALILFFGGIFGGIAWGMSSFDSDKASSRTGTVVLVCAILALIVGSIGEFAVERQEFTGEQYDLVEMAKELDVEIDEIDKTHTEHIRIETFCGKTQKRAYLHQDTIAQIENAPEYEAYKGFKK